MLLGADLDLPFCSLHYSTNLMSAPAAAITIIFMSLVSWWSDRVNARALVAFGAACWMIGPFIAVNFNDPSWPRAGRYILGLVLVGYPYW